MSTLTEDKQRAFEIGDINSLPVVAADIIYAGAAVGDNAGYARPLVAGDQFHGFCILRADNSDGAAGDINVQVRKSGCVVLNVTGVDGTDDIGKTVYASDDNTFTISTEAGNSKIGVIRRHESGTRCVVEFHAQAAQVADAAAATAGALTDNSGGVASQTLAAVTNLDTLTDSTGGVADDTVADVSTAVTGVDGVGSNAASKADVDTRLTAINNNFKELVDQVITQKAANTAIVNALASIADEVNKLIADVAAIRTALNAAI